MNEEEKKMLKIFSEEVKKEQEEYEQVNEYTKFIYNVHKIVLNIIGNQQKELEELKKENIELSTQITDGFWENDRLKNEIEQLNEIKQQICNEELITQDYVQENFIKKDKIKEILKNYLFTEGEGLKDFYQDIFELVREIDRSNEELVTLGELEYAVSHSEEFDFGDFNQETIETAVKIIEKLDKIIQSFESGEMITGVKNV